MLPVLLQRKAKMFPLILIALIFMGFKFLCHSTARAYNDCVFFGQMLIYTLIALFFFFLINRN